MKVAAGSGAVLLAGIAALSMVLDQPTQKVLISGSFQRVSPGDIELKLNTLPPPANPLSGRGDFWMDSPEFETNGLFAYLPKSQQ